MDHIAFAVVAIYAFDMITDMIYFALLSSGLITKFHIALTHAFEPVT